MTYMYNVKQGNFLLKTQKRNVTMLFQINSDQLLCILACFFFIQCFVL